MSSWYSRAELTRRISWFYSGNALANMFGGLLGAGILGGLDGAHGIAGWRWLFSEFINRLSDHDTDARDSY
jgi:MFS family permease